MAGGDVREPGERAEGEHERLRAVGLGHVAVTARDLLALDRAIHGPRGRRNISVLVRRKLRRTVVGGFRIVNTGIGRIRMSDGAGRTLHAERLGSRNRRRKTESEYGEKNLVELSHGSMTSCARVTTAARLAPRAFVQTGVIELGSLPKSKCCNFTRP